MHLSDEHTVGAVEFLSRLGLVEAIGVEIALTDTGKRIASSRIPARRRLFAEVAIRLPVIHEIIDVLARQPGRAMSRGELLEFLGAQSCSSDADRLFDHMVAWGRYAGLLSYDADTGDVSLQ
jgi:NitT/TauT family transport system ATP-binding protein